MTARTIVHALGGRWSGTSGMARCPAHRDRTRSLSVSGRDGRVLWHCFTGCDQRDVMAALKVRGLFDGGITPIEGSDYWLRENQGIDAPVSDIRARTVRAQHAWNSTEPADGTLVEIYPRGRGIAGPIPPEIRFEYCAKHDLTGLACPAMVAAVHAPDGSVAAVHRTYLRLDGAGKFVRVGPQQHGRLRSVQGGPEGRQAAL